MSENLVRDPGSSPLPTYLTTNKQTNKITTVTQYPVSPAQFSLSSTKTISWCAGKVYPSLDRWSFVPVMVSYQAAPLLLPPQKLG